MHTEYSTTPLFCDSTECIYNDNGECCLEPEQFADCYGEFPVT